MTRRCFHCGTEITGAAQTVRLNDAERIVCGRACADVVARIDAGGLGEYYAFRDGPPGSVPGVDSSRTRWSGFDRPALQGEFVTTREDGSKSAQLLVQGVRCAACAWLIERSVSALEGVTGVTVEPLTTRTSIQWDPRRIRLSEIMQRFAALGFVPLPYTADETDRAVTVERRAALRRLIVAGLGMMQVMSFAVALYAGAFQEMQAEIREFLRLVSLLVATPVVFYSGAPFFAGAWRSLANRAPGMDLPVALAIGGAYGASVWNTLVAGGEVYFDSATMFVFFLSAARFLEMSGRHRALSLTGVLARHLPQIATRVRADGRLEEVGTVELGKGDRVLVRPGQALPADGVLESDAARLDESLLTGESGAVLRNRGDAVVAGSVNATTAITVRVERVGAATTMAEIARIVTRAQQQKPALVQAADRIASKFVTAVVVAAAVIGLGWWLAGSGRAFEIVLAVLVVTCPCALALATPAALTVATGALARRGFMIRRAGAIPVLNRIDEIVFDKTGTLTEYEPGLGRIETCGGISRERAQAIAAALEAHSNHPLSGAFSGDGSLVAERVEAVAGGGLEGYIDGVRYRIGTARFVGELAGPSALDAAAGRPDPGGVWLGSETGPIACFEVTEKLRQGIRTVIDALRARGMAVTIASGDRESAVARVAAALKADDHAAGLSPEGKLALIRERQRRGCVAMVGDGINDAPVLAGADVSIALGSGTDLAQHSADCVLVGSRLDALIDALAVSRRTMRIVRENLAWAVIYNLVALPLAATGYLAPWMAALGMSASSLLVTLNALRIGRALPRTATAEQEVRSAPTPEAAR